MTAPAAYALSEIAERVGGTLEGADVSIRGVAAIEDAREGDLTFVANPKYRVHLETTQASAVLVAPDLQCPGGLAIIRTADPYAAFARVLVLFDPGLPAVVPGVHPTAVVAQSAELGEDVAVGPHAVVQDGARIGRGTRVAAGVFVGPDARIGEDCYLFPGVYVGRGCILGDRVLAQPRAVIGSDGFGYAPDETGLRKIPQIGIVEIADDVEIGANACIDRATLGKTIVGRGTKIDNLVQIAHNVAIAENSVLAAQVGVAGSTRIGKGVKLGGQAGLVGHIHIGDGVSVGAQAGVIGDIPADTTVSGYPARPHREAMRVEAAVRRLPELTRRVRALESEREEKENEETR